MGFIVIEAMVASILKNFDKYWSEVYRVMVITIVLDHRYEMELVEFFFLEIYEDKMLSFK